MDRAAIAYATHASDYEQMAQLAARNPQGSDSRAGVVALTVLFMIDHNPHLSSDERTQMIIWFSEAIAEAEEDLRDVD